jgi:hypothetical protein
MRRTVVPLLALSALACIPLPARVPVTNRPTDVLLLEGEWRGEFTSEDGQRGGSITFALRVRNDTARGPAVLTLVAYPPAEAGASAPVRAEVRSTLRSPIHFVNVTDGVVTGVVPAFLDADRLTMVQMTLVGRMRSWNVIEGTYLTLSTDLRVEERGSWRVVRGN